MIYRNIIKAWVWDTILYKVFEIGINFGPCLNNSELHAWVCVSTFLSKHFSDRTNCSDDIARDRTNFGA